MAIVFTGSGAGLFNRFGAWAGGLADSVAFQGGTATARVLSGASMATRGTTLETYAALSPAVSPELDGHWTAITSWRSAQSSLFSSFVALATKEWIRQVDADATLPSKDLTTAIKEVIRQMVAAGDSVNASTVSVGAQTTVSATGNPVIVATSKRYDGRVWQTVLPEVVRFTVTADSQSGGATARNEPLSIKGAATVSDTSSYQWPAGSGCSTSVNLVDAQSDNNKGTCLVNGDFETFTTANVPDNFTFSNGTASTNYGAYGSGYTQNNALSVTGDGSTLLTFYQEFGHAVSTSVGSGGTTYQIKPSTLYAVNFWIKAITSAPSAGVLRVALVDSAGAVLNDAFGSANSFTVDLTAVTTSFVAYNGAFRSPAALPSDGVVRLQFKLTTAVTNAKVLVVDDVGFAEMTSLYAGGPSVAAFAGATKVVKDDQWTVTTTNTMGALAAWLERAFLLRDKGLIIPYSGSPTIADSCVG